jgi:hypothetical protein
MDLWPWSCDHVKEMWMLECLHMQWDVSTRFCTLSKSTRRLNEGLHDWNTKQAAPEKPPCACRAARTHTHTHTLSSDTVDFCRVTSQYQYTMEPYKSDALRFLTETLNCATFRWHSGPLMWTADGEYTWSTGEMCAMLSVLYKVHWQAPTASKVKRLALLMLSGSSPHRAHCVSSCSGYNVTVCVTALQHIIFITLLLQNGTSITLQATGDRWVSG